MLHSTVAIIPGNREGGLKGEKQQMRRQTSPKTRCMRSTLRILVSIVSLASAQSDDGVTSERSQSVETGFLFVEGKYIPPPYVFRSEENGVSVNGVLIDYTSLGLGEHDFFKWDMVPREVSNEGDEMEVTFRRRPIRPRYPLRNIEPTLNADGIVVVFSGESPVSLDKWTGLLKLLSRTDKMQTSGHELKPFGNIDRNRWREWIANFTPTRGFLARAQYEMDQFEAIRRENDRAVVANQRLNAASYPLTVVGMLLVVVAVGHLLSYRPGIDTVAEPATLTPKEHRAVVYCLLLVGGLSALDLVWTLLAHQAGAMKELNPIGAHMVDNAQLLMTFKVALTTAAAVMLYVARRHTIARRACWWCCLICTLLAVRWISLTSAFV